MAQGKIRVATCQFDVSNSITENAQWITSFMHKAKEEDAEIIHFSECALSGYASVDIFSFDNYNWDALAGQTRRIQELAKELGLWVILGSSYKDDNFEKPFNCLYLINAEGEIIDRYDKRFCTPSDIHYYTPGDRFVTFEINGVRCTLLICYDLRFPELYRELKKMNIECVFQSFYNARQSKPSVHTHIMRQTMQCRAATNYLWVSMSNSSAPISPYPSCFIQPDGVITKELEFDKPGIMYNMIDTSLSFYDASGPYRELALNGILSNRGHEDNT